ncbi:MAG: family 43 glycosylhydrolase, partial [Alistipes sp.]|nr:family 43 glycosylhydrolase [Alistipes sp.]
GPYVDKQGRKMLDNHYEILLTSDSHVKGPGHNSQIITDDKGQDWIFYHGYDVNAPNAGRKMYMDRVVWIDGWPQITLDKNPSVTSVAPYIKK